MNPIFRMSTLCWRQLRSIITAIISHLPLSLTDVFVFPIDQEKVSYCLV
jgi:hypothetical protein